MVGGFLVLFVRVNFDKVFEKAYRNLKEINFEGIFYRKDIGHQVRTKSPFGELI